MSDHRLSFTQARASSRAELVNGWLSGGTLKLYSGTRPASADTAITDQVLLLSYPLDTPAGIVANGVLTISGLGAGLILASGSVTWARFCDSSNGVVGDADVTPTGGGGLVTMNNTALVEGGYLSVISFTLTEF